MYEFFIKNVNEFCILVDKNMSRLFIVYEIPKDNHEEHTTSFIKIMDIEKEESRESVYEKLELNASILVFFYNFSILNGIRQLKD